MEENPDKGPLFIGALGAVLFMAVLLVSRHLREDEQSATQATEIRKSQPVLQAPLLAPPLIPAEQPQQSPGTTVFECIRDGRRIFSDNPCGENATVRTISPSNTMDAPRPVYRPQRMHPPTQARYESSQQGEPVRDCTDYEEAVERIDAVMRRGYTSAEGERLRANRLRASKLRDDCYRENRTR